MRLTVGISGASGVNLALKFIKQIPKDIEIFVVFSKSSKKALKLENGIKTKEIFKNDENITLFKDKNIGADSLITRAFSVMLKEKREIIIAPRELPLNTIMLENMLKLSNLGVVIAPPILGYYSSQQTLEDMENFIIGKWMDLLKIDNKLYKRWK